MADRLAENGAIQFAQESSASVGTVSRLAGAGQIEAEIRRLVDEGFYTQPVSALTVKGRLINAALAAFNPSRLFAAGEVGTWFDPSDMTTLFQNASGTTPVTAVEQPVSLMLDKSKGLVIGSELSAYASGFTSTTGIIGQGATVAISGTSLVITSTSNDGSDRGEIPISGLDTTKRYQVTIVARRGAQGTNQQIFSSTALDIPLTVILSTSNTTYSYKVLALATSGIIRIYSSGPAGAIGDSVIVDSISVKEIAGNHAYTPSTASTSRPTLSARYNLLLATATLATQNVTVTAGDHTLYFTGAGSITLSGTGSGTYNAGTHTITTTAGTLTLTVTGSVLTADLRRANDGVGLPAYQRVTTSTDYDTVNFPPYLRFDGSNDYMLTNSIDFTGTDKILVSAPVRKLSDAAQGVLVELSATIASNNGTFLLAAPDAANATFAFDSKGTTQTDAVTGTTYAAPTSRVLTGIGNISGDSVSLRVNGVLIDTDTGDQGSGNYGNFPLYIGRRGGTTLPFSGRLYGLVTRAGTSTESEITNLETWFNSKAKIY